MPMTVPLSPAAHLPAVSTVTCIMHEKNHVNKSESIIGNSRAAGRNIDTGRLWGATDSCV